MERAIIYLAGFGGIGYLIGGTTGMAVGFVILFLLISFFS